MLMVRQRLMLFLGLTERIKTVNIARIFVAPEHFNKGFGMFIMKEIEEMHQEVRAFVLDTPLWNVRTNRF